jgi:hypothetical protein
MLQGKPLLTVDYTSYFPDDTPYTVLYREKLIINSWNLIKIVRTISRNSFYIWELSMLVSVQISGKKKIKVNTFNSLHFFVHLYAYATAELKII